MRTPRRLPRSRPHCAPRPAALAPALLLVALPALPAQDDKPAPAKPQDANATRAATAPALTREEVAAGWRYLFDGSAADAWRGYQSDDFPAQGWDIVDGALHHQAGGGGGDLITRRQFGNFELELEWRVARGANSGIIYRASEAEDQTYKTGPEYQVLDDSAHDNAERANWSAGALYGLYTPEDKRTMPPLAWNTARISVLGDHVEHWLNGKRLLTADIGSDDWKRRVAGSKFAEWPSFGTVRRGHICLQDHGDEVWYRNVRIRELPPAPDRMGKEIVLFDGKNLDAFAHHLQDGGARDATWSIEDGVLVCKGKPTGYLYTKAEYESFVLTLEWRFDPAKGAGNSGVLLRRVGEHKVWPKSIEAQLHSGNAGDFWNIGEVGMQVDPARTRGRNTKKTHANEKELGEWNRYEIVVDGSWVSLRVNGEVLNEAWDCDVVPGNICLQSEGAEIHFRDIRLVPLR